MTEPGPSAANWSYRFAAAAVLGVFGAQRWQFDIQGIEHLPSRGGALIAANHIGFWDMFTIARDPYVRLGRPVRMLAKASLFTVPVVGPLMRRAGHIAVRRTAGASAVRQAIAALRRGEMLLVLPEQTISPSFELLDFKAGATRIAAAAQVPLIPAVSWGSHRFHTVGRRPRPTWRLPVSVCYGDPLLPRRGDDQRELTATLRQRMDGMLKRLQLEYPDGAPTGAWWVPARLGGAAPTVEEANHYLAELAQRWRRASVRRTAPRDAIDHRSKEPH